MERQNNSRDYVLDTIEMEADFIQLLGGQGVRKEDTELLKSNDVRINYHGTNDPRRFRELIENGVEFPLTDDLVNMMPVVRELGVKPVKPIYRANVPALDVKKSHSQLLEQRSLKSGRANQGIALAPDAYYSSTAGVIYRFNIDWELQQKESINIEGVNHLGAIDYHDGYLWAGLLHGPEGGEHDPKKNRSVIAKIDAEDLTVVKTWDITRDVTWIDPVCFDGQSLYVGDLSDLGIHRYDIQDDELVRTGIFRYPRSLHFSQGIRVRDGKLYSIHTFGDADGLFEFKLPEKWTDEIQQPTRAWKIIEPVIHCEGFDFIPGQPDQIWHAQDKQVDRYQLLELED